MLSLILDSIGETILKNNFTLFQEFESQLNKSDRERLGCLCLKNNRVDLLEKLNLTIPLIHHAYQGLNNLNSESLKYLMDHLSDENLRELLYHPDSELDEQILIPLLDRILDDEVFNRICSWKFNSLIHRYIDDERVTKFPRNLDFFNTSLIQEFLNRPKFSVSNQWLLEETFHCNNYDFRHLITSETQIFRLINEKSDPQILIPLIQKHQFQLTQLDIAYCIFGSDPIEIRAAILRQCLNPDVKILTRNISTIYASKLLLSVTIEIEKLEPNNDLVDLFRLAVLQKDDRAKIFLRSHYYFTFLYSQVPKLIEKFLEIDSYLLNGIQEDSLQWKAVQSRL